MQIDRKAFARAVALVTAGVSRRELFSNATKISITSGYLMSYDDEIAIQHRFPDIGDIEGAVEGVPLYELLQRVTDKTINVEAVGSELHIRAGNNTRTLAMVPVDLPIDPIDLDAVPYRLPPEFRHELRLISSICATDQSRPLLTAVHLGDGIVEGSDGYRVARVRSRARLPDIPLPAFEAG